MTAKLNSAIESEFESCPSSPSIVVVVWIFTATFFQLPHKFVTKTPTQVDYCDWTHIHTPTSIFLKHRHTHTPGHTHSGSNRESLLFACLFVRLLHNISTRSDWTFNAHPAWTTCSFVRVHQMFSSWFSNLISVSVSFLYSFSQIKNRPKFQTTNSKCFLLYFWFIYSHSTSLFVQLIESVMIFVFLKWLVTFMVGKKTPQSRVNNLKVKCVTNSMMNNATCNESIAN